MTDMIKVGIIGCMGRMGQANADAVMASRYGMLAAVCDRTGHPLVGDVYRGTDLIISDTVKEVIEASDVVIDFTPPGNTSNHAAIAATEGTAYIVGTTGLDTADEMALNKASAQVAVVQAGNFSLGVNLLTALTEKVAASLSEDWDIEIVEMHHKHKVDAPSGTALMLGEAAAAGRGVILNDVACKARDGITGERPAGQIGFATLRGGAVIGEHEVIFASDSERLTLSHRAGKPGTVCGWCCQGSTVGSAQRCRQIFDDGCTRSRRRGQSMNEALQALLNGFPVFLLHFTVSLLILIVGTYIYMLVTRHDELKLLKQGNTAVAISFSAAVLGLALPIAFSLAASISIWDLLFWGLVALVMQILAFRIVDLILSDISKRLQDGDIAAATFAASVKLSIAAINAAAISG